MDDGPELVSRDQLLAGLGARRAGVLLYALESRAGFLATRARHATAPAICDDLVEARERAFLSAFATGRDLPQAVRIQELERFAPSLRHLIPPDPAQRAAVAARIGAKYAARASDVPRLRAVLGLTEPEVQDALLARHGRTVDELWASGLPWRDRLRWWRSRLVTRVEELPPFWTAYAITLTQTVGAGLLALPIALAGLGPLPGLLVVIVLGLVNVATLGCLAESFARTGSVRWGGAYFGRVVGQHLGAAARAVVSGALVALAIVILLAYYVGFSSVLAAATGTPVAVWTAALFGVSAALVWRGRLDATVASALLVGAVNLLIIVVLSVLAFADLDLDNLTHAAVPGLAGQPFDPGIVAVVFGVVLVAYFGHMSVANCARVVLARDTGGRSLMRGSAAGMLTSVAVYGVWTLAVGGAVDPDRLARETRTALEPLAEASGPAVLVIGAVFAVLAMGMAAVHMSFGLHFQTRELVARSGTAGRLLAMLPLVVVFAVAATLLVTGNESFTGSLGAVGTLAVPVVAGVVPVLLLVAARHRGDQVPASTLPVLGSRPANTVVVLVFVLALVFHATLIWTTLPARLVAGAVAAMVIVLTVRVLRSDSVRPLATVELRRDRDLRRSRLSVVADGAYVPTTATVESAAGSRDLVVFGRTDLPTPSTAVSVDLTGVPADQFTVVVHEVDTAGAAAPMEAITTLHDGESTVPLPADGSAVRTLPPIGAVRIDLARRAGRPEDDDRG
jgi:amino acid permease